MFDSPFDFFSLVIAIVAFIFARKAFNQAAQLRARIDMSTLTGRLPRAVVHVPGAGAGSVGCTSGSCSGGMQRRHQAAPRFKPALDVN